MPLHVAELWRYPVKSLAGEPLEAADVLETGLVGDRVVHVRAPNGRIVTSRTHPGLLGLRGRLCPDGEPLVDGVPWSTDRARTAVRGAAGIPVELVRDDSPERFDVLPLHVVTDGTVAALGFDRRRLRPNIVVAGVDGLDEREWPGHLVRLGPVVIKAARLRPRCVMTTYDPDTQAQDNRVLRSIVDGFEGRVGLDAAVVVPGRIAVGDPVEILP